QFSEHTHAIQGLDANSMHNIYKELCPNVFAVSSDLSGQGKTKWIEEQNVDSSIQIVARYLDAHDRNIINTVDIDLNDRKQLIPEMQNSIFKDIRKILLETLIGVSMDIASRSVNSKKDQLKNLSNEKDEDVIIKPWEDLNHLLVFFLSQSPDSEFELDNFDNMSSEDILKILESETIAEKSEIWLFFDEINSCNHIGILADLIAHRLLLGKEIHKNIRLFAACNPYRLRQKADTQAGLQADRYKERSRLVYQVRPLPDQILDFVWDYGVLKPSDEKIYINMLVKRSQEDSLMADLFTELLFASQEF
ncbi:9823_t:CDS:2, partial [Gigaspora margarita]